MNRNISAEQVQPPTSMHKNSMHVTNLIEVISKQDQPDESGSPTENITLDF